MNPTQAMQQVHSIRRGLSEIVRRYEDQGRHSPAGGPARMQGDRMSERATRIEFTQFFEDGSGPRIAVRYDATSTSGLQVEIVTPGETVAFSADEIVWLRDVLWRVRNEIPSEGS